MRRAIALLSLLLLPLAVPDPSWAWPVAPPHEIVRPYIAPATPYGSGHRGIDVRAPGGTVFAPAAGVVHFAGVVVDRPVLSIRHPGGLISSYEPVTSTLTAGAPVRRGEAIGSVVPGHCASPCLHFGVRLDGEYVNPLRLLGGLPFSVLLPTR
ncbi:M23 family metallopeptidase [Leifsonia sp. H3M29-4]|uniref:M23 family metallopeptidase n=1 Tax=Salinibacterium metalliresistens TaxID=3031321 RepID=UPI0023D9D918|nr:M23 family metallopeptidase [Salinibacterium metalliresistens]MDF1478670.1 M23 family metallopeptidase [Salinibacterium metalliresistens]